MSSKNHYENHLHKYYSWIYGGLENKVQENLNFFIENKIIPKSTKTAIDLGAGSGFQSIPLAKLGFQVVAVDFSNKLLEELINSSTEFKIEILENDILDFKAYSNYNPELIVCMGDTLTHLENLSDVKKLIKNCYELLNEDGKLILSFRDLTNELEDENRFIPVRSNENIIFTCFLEYFKDHVKVHDIVNEKINGKWQQIISCYNKIKISEECIKTIIKENNFNADCLDLKNGFITVICIK